MFLKDDEEEDDDGEDYEECVMDGLHFTAGGGV